MDKRDKKGAWDVKAAAVMAAELALLAAAALLAANDFIVLYKLLELERDLNLWALSFQV